MYPDIDTLKKEAEKYLKSNDSERFAKWSNNKWTYIFENKIHGKVNNLNNNLLCIK